MYYQRLLSTVLIIMGITSCSTNIYGVNDTIEQLFEAVRTKNHEVIKTIVKETSPSSRDKHNNTPLHIAAYIGDPISVEILVKAGGNPNLKNFKGTLPIDYAELAYRLDTWKDDKEEKYKAIVEILSNN